MQERLQKIIARAGIASRRKAEELILQGQVSVNGNTVKKLGAKADLKSDHIKVNGRRIKLVSLEYYVINKPQGVLSAVSDALHRPLVTELVKSQKRLYPAGRLDFQSEGLMILSNDGELTRKLTCSGLIRKVYRVKVQGQLEEFKVEQLRRGVTIGAHKLASCRIRLLKRDRNSWYEVTLYQGRNRQIRRMFENIGHPVMRLRRTVIGTVCLGNLPPGGARRMSDEELTSLKGS